ncbi:MAG TPA: ABC transporter permease [Candidatus Nitrosotenuis sp.]|jgi:simple sugar transport system permease protein|nr:ABC transporter permease [Candidatus Nitrosotenuis sp.]
MRRWADLLVPPLVAIAVALLLGALVIWLVGKDPLEAYRALFLGSVGSKRRLAETLLKAVPLILTGLSVALAFHAGLFNIGGEGQFLVGGMAGAIVGFSLGLPPALHIPLTLLGGLLGGAVYGFIPAWLKVRFGVHEVINTIMLNWIALLVVQWMVSKGGPFHDAESGTGSPEIAASAQLPILLEGTRLHYGLFLSLAVALLVAYILRRTTTGYELKAVGFSPLAAEYGGISLRRNVLLAMSLAGAFAGVAGAMQYMGLENRVPVTLDFSGYGFDGIAVALVGRNDPFGVILAALLFAALRTGGQTMQLEADISKDLVSLVQAIVILFMVAPEVFRFLLPRLRPPVIEGEEGGPLPLVKPAPGIEDEK